MTTRSWHPITPLEPHPKHDFSPVDDLRQQWLERGPHNEDPSLTALHRSWTIETGIIEGLYRLDDAQTRILIERGFEPANIPQTGTGQNPENLLAILQNHITALDAIYGEARSGRSISRTAIRQRTRSSSPTSPPTGS